MVISGPRPQIGRPATVEIIETSNNWYPLIVPPGQYKVQEAQRFGDKVSTGAIAYQDFNPYESAAVSAHFQGGYGLREYTDIVLTPVDPSTFVKETSNVDTSEGIAILSPAIPTETLPNSSAPVVWMGELTVSGTTQFYAVCGFQGACIYSRGSGGTWTQCSGTTAAAPVAGAVGAFNGALLLGYGASSATPAQFTTSGGTTFANVTDGTGNVYVGAYTADKVSAYIAGGISGGFGANGRGSSQVMASTTSSGAVFDPASIVKCGNPDWPITGLAPGGGLVNLYVAKQDGLGEIDTSNVYRTIMPFSTRLPRNGLGLRWFFARGAGTGPAAPATATPEGGSDAVGPLILLVPRDNQLWTYAPSSASAGQAQNLTVWANPELRPPNARGETRALLGTARWLYSAITDVDGHTWILKRDGRTGATHTWLDLGVQTCTALGTTPLDGTTVGAPHLFIGYGNNVVNVTLPFNTEWPPDDSSCRYQTSGTLDTPDIDLGFPSEPKILFSVQVVADNLSLNQTCEVFYALEDGSFQVLGTATVSPLTEILFGDPRPSVHHVTLRASLTTTDTTQTPELRALVLRCSLNPKLYRLWNLVAILPAGAGTLPSDALRNPKTVLDGLWAIRRAGIPVIFQDRWKTRYQVRIMEIEETEIAREPGGPLESAVALQLLEVSGSAALVGQQVFTMGTWTNLWFPMDFPGNGLGPAVLSGSATITNNEPSAVYPTWQIAGPGHIPTLTNGADVWTLNTDVPSGQVVTVQFDPTKHTVVGSDGTDYSSHVLGGSVWWSLAAGANSVSVVMGGATYPASMITLQYPL